MARRRARPTNVAILALAGLVSVVLVGYPLVGSLLWWRAEPSDLDVVVFNATVPFEDRRQQRAVDLILEHLRVGDYRFVGADPGGIDVGTWPTVPPDLVFLVDGYGVYLDDIEGYAERDNARLTRALGDPVIPDLERWVAAGTFLYGEFNVLHPPTPPDLSERLQALFGIDATGWAGRWYTDLDEMGPRLRALATEPIPDGEAGLILVSQPVGDVTLPAQLVVLTGEELSGNPPTISGHTPDGRRVEDIPMLEWFSLIRAADAADVTMWLDLPIATSAAEVLAGLSIPARTPMLVLGEGTAYFAGNMARTSAEFPMRRMAGSLELLRRLPQSDAAAGFYQVTGPTLSWIVQHH